MMAQRGFNRPTLPLSPVPFAATSAQIMALSGYFNHHHFDAAVVVVWIMATRFDFEKRAT
jgi:hypothetical protein